MGALVAGDAEGRREAEGRDVVGSRRVRRGKLEEKTNAAGRWRRGGSDGRSGSSSAPAAGARILGMMSVKARVRNGRLVLDEPTELPEGAVVELVAIDASDAGDELDAEERAALHAALEEGHAQADAGDTVEADEVLAALRRRVS